MEELEKAKGELLKEKGELQSEVAGLREQERQADPSGEVWARLDRQIERCVSLLTTTMLQITGLNARMTELQKSINATHAQRGECNRGRGRLGKREADTPSSPRQPAPSSGAWRTRTG